MLKTLILSLLTVVVFTTVTPNPAFAIKSPFTKTKNSYKQDYQDLLNETKNVWRSKRGKKLSDFTGRDVDDFRTQGDKFLNKTKSNLRAQQRRMGGRRGARSFSNSSSSGFNE